MLYKVAVQASSVLTHGLLLQWVSRPDRVGEGVRFAYGYEQLLAGYRATLITPPAGVSMGESC